MASVHREMACVMVSASTAIPNRFRRISPAAWWSIPALPSSAAVLAGPLSLRRVTTGNHSTTAGEMLAGQAQRRLPVRIDALKGDSARRDLQPVLALEDDIQHGGDHDHKGDGEREARLVTEAGIRHVHAVEAGDEGRHGD